MQIYDISKRVKDMLKENPVPDERELTRNLLRDMNNNQRVHFYQISQRAESKIGADWLWLIYTNRGVYGLIVQAKRLREASRVALQNNIKYKKQMITLLRTSQKTQMPAIYILFSKDSISGLCRNMILDTEEGVFFDTAEDLKQFVQSSNYHTAPYPKILPLTCLFSCLSRECHYFKSPQLCDVCLKCDGYGQCIAEETPNEPMNDLLSNDIDPYRRYFFNDMHISQCKRPFEIFFKEKYNIDCMPSVYSEALLPLLFAESIIRQRPSLVLSCLKQGIVKFRYLERIISNVVITDYTHKHENDYSQLLVGQDFIVDSDTVYKKDEILGVLEEEKKSCKIIRKLGLFGSYARQTANGKSDIDIAIIYKETVVPDEAALAELVRFFQKIILHFKKNVDFVDYNAAKRKEECEEFIETINSYIVWV